MLFITAFASNVYQVHGWQKTWKPERKNSARSGQVNFHPKKLAGVKAIAEDIQIGVSPAYNKTDAEIAEGVLNGLKWNTAVQEEKIKIKVENGYVTLEGKLICFNFNKSDLYQFSSWCLSYN